MKTERPSVVVLGAGPAGLGAALQLGRRDVFDVTLIERSGAVGGNAGSFDLEGLRVDYGSHRLHPSTKPEIMAEIREMLGPELLDRPRHGRMRVRGRWVHFPLKPVDLALRLPPGFMLGTLADAVTKRFQKDGAPTFASVLEKGLGRTICRDFYFPYAAKIWGVSPVEIDAEQAFRRVSASSFGKMLRKVLNAVPGFKPEGAGRFFYPRRGYGQISEAYYEAAQRTGVNVLLRTSVSGLELENGRAVAVRAAGASGDTRFPARQVLSTIPLPILARVTNPAPPSEVLAAAGALQYRAMILIYLVLETDQFTEFDAHYFPEPEIQITRLSEPKNYGLAPLPGATVLCAELPCAATDPIWRASDEELGKLVLNSLARAGLPTGARLRKVVSRRLEQAYPIYLRGYRQYFDLLDAWAGSIEGLLTLGRQGLFAHDNTHHALAMAYAASECLDDGANLDRAHWADYRLAFQSHIVED